MKIITNFPIAVFNLDTNKAVAGYAEEKFSSLDIHSDKELVFTEAELTAEIARLDAEDISTQYQRDRQYPALGEQLDMLFHDMTAGKGTKDGEWYKAIAKIKADNPKE